VTDAAPNSELAIDARDLVKEFRSIRAVDDV